MKLGTWQTIEKQIFALTTLLICTSLAYTFRFQQEGADIVFDASQYLSLAEAMLKDGLFCFRSHLRTYAYPLFLAACLRAAKIFSFDLWRLVYTLTQTFIYWSACLILSKSIYKSRERNFQLALFLLSGNIYVLPYLSLPLSDGLYTACVMVWFALLANMLALHSLTFSTALVYASQIGFGSGLILEVRPAGIWTLSTAIIAVYVLARRTAINQSLFGFGRIFLRFGAGLAVAVAPQLWINWQVCRRFTALPCAPLGENQIDWGIQYLKYATRMVPTPGPLFYINPLVGTYSGAPYELNWYVNHPVNALGTLFLKLCGAFDFDYLFCYINNLDPPFVNVVAATASSVFVIATFGMFRGVFDEVFRIRRFGSHCLLMSCLVGWAAITLISAVELRFTLPILTLCLAFVPYEIALWWGASRSRRAIQGIICIVVVVMMQIGGHYVRHQKSFESASYRSR